MPSKKFSSLSSIIIPHLNYECYESFITVFIILDTIDCVYPTTSPTSCWLIPSRYTSSRICLLSPSGIFMMIRSASAISANKALCRFSFFRIRSLISEAFFGSCICTVTCCSMYGKSSDDFFYVHQSFLHSWFVMSFSV